VLLLLTQPQAAAARSECCATLPLINLPGAVVATFACLFHGDAAVDRGALWIPRLALGFTS
jgi:hypothetical protein